MSGAPRRSLAFAAIVSAAFAAGCATEGSLRRPPEGFDPRSGVWLPSDPEERAPYFAFAASDPAVGSEDQLRISWFRESDGDLREAFVGIDFYPTAITGDGPELVYLAGLRGGDAVVVEQELELEDELELGDQRTLLESEQLDTITCLALAATPDGEARLVLLDAPRAQLWSLDLETSALALLADGSDRRELVGKRSFFALPQEGSRDVHYLLFERFPFEVAIGGAERVVRLIDVGGDFTIDAFETMSGAEYQSGEERDSPPR